MTDEDFKHFVCIVADDNPEEFIKEFSYNKLVPAYIKYKKEEAPALRQDLVDKAKATPIYDEDEKQELQEYIDFVSNMSDEDIIKVIAEKEGDIVDKQGNIVSEKNPEGKYTYYKIGKMFSMPFITLDGKEQFQAKKNEIDWEKIHLNGGHIYERVWEMVIDGDGWKDDYEHQIFENMKDKTTYLKKFGTKENYMLSNTAFWGYAFLSKETGWLDARNEESQFKWMKEYYDRFIKDLPEDTLLTIFECTK